MSEDRPYMMVYKDKWKALTSCMQPAERNRVMAAFFDYLTFGKEPKGLTRTGMGFFEFLRTSEENGKHRGAPFGNSNRRNKSKGIEKSNQDELKNELKNQSKNQCSTEAEAEAYTDAECNAEELNGAPTLDDVRSFVGERGLKINPVRFFKYYKATGWKRKGDPIEDWRALAELWNADNDPQQNDTPVRHPVKTMVRCPSCNSLDTVTRLDYAVCNKCGKGFDWDHENGGWLEEKA